MVLKGVGFDLYYATERVSSDILDDLYALADESHALEKMRRMQAGEVINRIEGCESENRAVLHTAMRDQFSDRQTAAPAAGGGRKSGVGTQETRTFFRKA